MWNIARRASWVVENISEFVSGYVCFIGLFLSAIIITHAVIVRYILAQPTLWQIEIAIYLLLQATYVGAAYGQKYKSHIRIDIITVFLPEKPREILYFCGSVVTMVCAGIVAWLGWGKWWEATKAGWVSIYPSELPLTYPYILLPLGMTLLFLQYFVTIVI